MSNQRVRLSPKQRRNMGRRTKRNFTNPKVGALETIPMDKFFDHILTRYGSTPGTTFLWLRENNQPAWFAWQQMHKHFKVKIDGKSHYGYVDVTSNYRRERVVETKAARWDYRLTGW